MDSKSALRCWTSRELNNQSSVEMLEGLLLSANGQPSQR